MLLVIPSTVRRRLVAADTGRIYVVGVGLDKDSWTCVAGTCVQLQRNGIRDLVGWVEKLHADGFNKFRVR